VLQVREVVKPAIPFAIQSAASLSAFTLGLALTQARCRCASLFSCTGRISYQRSQAQLLLARHSAASLSARALGLALDGGAGAPVLPLLLLQACTEVAGASLAAAAQAAGLACRVSCATPVLGSALGVVGIGAASALAGQAAIFCRRELERGRGSGRAAPWAPPPPLLRRQDLVLDALLGVALFKACRGLVEAHDLPAALLTHTTRPRHC